jgi:hypothetical protein
MRLFGAMILTAGVLLPNSAGACDTPLPQFLQIDMSPSVDTMPPEAPVLGEVRVGRSYGPRDGGCSQSGSSCDGSGALGIQIEPGHDDRTAPDDLGYLIRLREGSLPGGAMPSKAPVLLLSGGLYVSFPDPGPDEQEPIDLTFEVVAVDRAGNESAPTVARATSPGDEGCAFAGRPRSGTFARLMIVIALPVLIARRLLRRRNVLPSGERL